MLVRGGNSRSPVTDEAPATHPGLRLSPSLSGLESKSLPFPLNGLWSERSGPRLATKCFLPPTFKGWQANSLLLAHRSPSHAHGRHCKSVMAIFLITLESLSITQTDTANR